MTLKLAWRNLFRNTRRTVIACTGMGIGLAALIFCDALILGMEQNMIRTATASFLGEGQIHAATYRRTRRSELTIRNSAKVLAELRTDARVEQATARAMALGMISSASGPRSVLLVGVQPQTEQALSQVDDAIVAGDYFRGTSDQALVIGRTLAERLEVEIGDRVVVTAAQPHTGELSQELFRVSGIYSFDSKMMDQGLAFVRIGKARDMLGIPEAAHEIAIRFRDADIAQHASHTFWSDYSIGGNEALGWPELVPQLKAVFGYSQFSIAIIGGILFGLVALGIVNTLFMSIYERVFEFGVLRALGTRPLRIWCLVVCEAGCLATLGIGIGAALAALISWIVGQTGIDYRGIEMVGVVIQDLMYPVMTVRQFVFYPFWLFVLTLCVGIYPAVHAARLPPARALRRSL